MSWGRKEEGETGRRRREGKHLLRCKIQKEMKKEKKILDKFMRVMAVWSGMERKGREL